MFKRIFPHLTIILGLMCVTLFIFDRFNGVLALLSNEISKVIILVLSISAIITSVMLIGRFWNDDEMVEEAKEKRARRMAMKASESREK